MNNPATLTIPGWDEYQSYKDGRPIHWIKLHIRLLDNPEFRSLPDTDKAALVGIWLVYARRTGGANAADSVPADPSYLSAITGCRITKKTLGTLESYGFVRISTASPCDSVPREEERRGEESREEETLVRVGDMDGFDEFWATYPKKVGKKDARKAWVSASDKPGIVGIMSKLSLLKMSAQWRDQGGRFIPNPATWLRRGGWDDEIEAEVKTGAKYGPDGLPLNQAARDEMYGGK